MELIKAKRRVRIKNLPAGSLFMTDDNTCIALKSEYRTDQGTCQCFILETGEFFCAGAKTANDLNNMLVTPLIIVAPPLRIA